MRIPKFDRPSFVHNLERTLTNRGLKPSTLNLGRLASDLLAAVDDAEHKTPGAILDELGALLRVTLPAYNKAKPFGPRLPAADNVEPHIPDVDDADFLVAHREPFHVAQWLEAFASLTQWAASNTQEDPRTLPLEQVLVDLLIEHPDVAIGERTARRLAGSIGMDQLAETLTVSRHNRYYGQRPAAEDELLIDLTAGPNVWNL